MKAVTRKYGEIAYQEKGRMVSARFSTVAGQKSEELARSLVDKLMDSPRTTAYRELDAELLREGYGRFIADLTDWLLKRSAVDAAEKCADLGRLRARQRIPLEQCVNAMLICRDHIVESLRQGAEVSMDVCDGKDGMELFGELEFVVAINHFFDDAIFFCMKGYLGYRPDCDEVA